MPKLKVAVVKGGPSKEHEVSLNSAASVLENLDKQKYEAIDVFVSKQGKWNFGEHKDLSDDEAIQILKDFCDVIFLAVHGTYGEDGVLQAKLENAGVKFTGSGSKASALAFDKGKAQEVYERHGLRAPKAEILKSPQDKISIEIPLVVKPIAQGSSVGVSIVKHEEQLTSAITDAFQHDERVIVQEYIEGREVSCGVLDVADGLQALPPTELIVKNAEFFDYKAKYTVGETDEITPPDMSADIIQKIQDSAVKAHEILGCKDYSRTDMIVRGQEIFIIETNTLPGMTRTSILPQQAKVAGMTFSELLDRIIAAA